MTEPRRVPDVNDLRVKLCFICREEELFDSEDNRRSYVPSTADALPLEPDDPPRAWTHPCSCTLVAHESCLLNWIKAAQADPDRSKNALKCPQCSTTYELESDNPRALRILNAANVALSQLGQVATVCAGVTLVASFGFTLYFVATSYGVFAVREFLGEEVYQALLGDDPAKWPLHAFINLPAIPLSLILSRTRFFDSFPLIPLLTTWSTSPPVNAPGSPSIWGWARPAGARAPSPLFTWPPSPLMSIILLPVVRHAYRRVYQRLTKYAMDGPHDPTDHPIRRIIWDGLGPFNVLLRINNIPPPAPAPVAPARPNGEAAGQADGGGDDNDAADAAARALRVTNSSIGRFVGGALLLPVVAGRMGALLLRLSRRSAWLRAFLAVGVRAAAPPARVQLFPSAPGAAPTMAQLSMGLAAGLHVMAGGTPTWNSCEPVWWRNTVGLGLFVVAKDCVRLFHLWLTKREMESRRIKNRNFTGVDIRELDLINPPPNGTSTPAPAIPDEQPAPDAPATA
ncbi:uncharacterized protein BXZ73DRAFT_52026 [Epithele typhae]|uniref:uncharacterized protein n=1 Tax=Epithele typhae TaxID=378194 RepID=UPI002007A74B|nr:uncharacterized protein BXZ73DRAFT_52026 [Epithele typhae]KAH9920890.1 hypothetical protein BXZ73DRAFT_52026 [Epithele typhae]